MFVQKALLFYLSFDLDRVFNIICFQYTYGVGPTSGSTLGQILTCTWEDKKKYQNKSGSTWLLFLVVFFNIQWLSIYKKLKINEELNWHELRACS